MKYETLTLIKSGSIPALTPIDYVFTFNNNIDHIVCLFYKEGNNEDASPGLMFQSINISGKVLTVTMYPWLGLNPNYTFMLATVASY